MKYEYKRYTVDGLIKQSELDVLGGLGWILSYSERMNRTQKIYYFYREAK